MTSTRPDDETSGTRKRLLYGRSFGPLLGPWIACLIIGGGVFYLETSLPVFHEVVKIVYFILAVVLFIATGRWLRFRRGNRRDADRRHADRRSEGARTPE